MREFEMEFLKCGTPSPNNRLYSKELMKQALDLRLAEQAIYGEVNPSAGTESRFSNKTHKLLVYHFEDDRLIGKFVTLDNQAGRNLENLLDLQVGFYMAPTGLGCVDPDSKVVTEYTILAIDIWRR